MLWKPFALLLLQCQTVLAYLPFPMGKPVFEVVQISLIPKPHICFKPYNTFDIDDLPPGAMWVELTPPDPNNIRDRFHYLLDQALDTTRQGDNFLGNFVNLVIKK